MIASGYTLDVYCDTPGCVGGKYEGDIARDSFSDESKRVCWATARKRGWLVSAGRSICPACRKKGWR